MIDYNRYDCNILPECDGKTIDAIRIVFPRGKVNEAVEVGKTIRNKGYRIYFQAANTIGYTDEELLEMIEIMNEVKPEGVSIVDTFGKMYPSDLAHLISIVDKNLDKTIKLGFHSHNNQQLSFALTMQFVECLLSNTERTMVIDSSLCGMGRGAGNTCTELIVNYLNNVQKMDYDLNVIMDTIDQYISVLMDK